MQAATQRKEPWTSFDPATGEIDGSDLDFNVCDGCSWPMTCRSFDRCILDAAPIDDQRRV